MGSFSDIPSLVCATTAVPPYRFVKVNGRNTGTVCAAITDALVGVADGSTSSFSGTNNAEIGGPINLQGGNVVLVEASTTISAGAVVGTSANGRAVTAATTARIFGVALEPASAAGEIIRVFKCSPAIVA